jgi:hypothetical protein
MAPEGFCSPLSKLHAAPRAARLRSCEDGAVLGYGERPADLVRAAVEVHVVPLQPEQLSLTEAGVYRQHVEGFEAVPSFVRHLKQGGGSRGLAVVMLAGHTSRKIHVHFHERNHNGQ